MPRFVAFAALCCACGSDPQISAEPPAHTAEPVPTVEPAPSQTATPEQDAAPPPVVTQDAAPAPTAPPPIILSPPAPAAPPKEQPPAGFHEAAGGACYLPNMLQIGACKCAVYDAQHKLVTPGDMCFDSCSYNAEGIGVMHAFCVDGGLLSDMTPEAAGKLAK